MTLSVCVEILSYDCSNLCGTSFCSDLPNLHETRYGWDIHNHSAYLIFLFYMELAMVVTFIVHIALALVLTFQICMELAMFFNIHHVHGTSFSSDLPNIHGPSNGC